MSRAFVAFGANVGDAGATIAAAVSELGRLGRIVAVSRVYRTRPIGPPQPDYLNGAVELETALDPEPLLERLHGIEAAHGRVRDVRFGPRTLDLDLIWFDGLQADGPAPILPHPRAHEREFVLRPLADLDPDLPLGAHTVAEWLDGLEPQGVEATSIRLG